MNTDQIARLEKLQGRRLREPVHAVDPVPVLLTDPVEWIPPPPRGPKDRLIDIAAAVSIALALHTLLNHMGLL